MDTSSALNTCEYFNITLCLGYEHHYSFCVFGVASQMKFSLAQTTPIIPFVYIRGCMLGSDLTKPDYVSTLGYHWTEHTGRPLEPQVHWDATGTPLADANTQWWTSVNLHNWNTLGDHWNHKHTGMPLVPHWLILAPSCVPVAIQC